MNEKLSLETRIQSLQIAVHVSNFLWQYLCVLNAFVDNLGPERLFCTASDFRSRRNFTGWLCGTGGRTKERTTYTRSVF